MDGRPLDVLEESLGDVVTVQLKDGETYRGALGGFDQHMNLVLEPTEAPAEAEGMTPTEVEDTTVIRGDNVVTIKP